MPIVTTEAIVLRTIDYSETSLVVWCYTREQGRVHVLAKGARRARSPFEGALEPLVEGELVYYRKAKSDGLETAKEFDPKDLHLGLRTELRRLYRGLYVGELLLAMSERDLPGLEAYDAASEALKQLSQGPPDRLDEAVFRCELTLLAASGLSPRLSGCARCDAPLPDAPRIAFDPASGGVLCPEHAPSADRSVKQPLWIPRGAFLSLLAVAARRHVRIGHDLAVQIRQLLDAFLTWHLERPLRMPGEIARIERAPR